MDKEHFIAGGISGLCEVTLSHPIDVLKTRIQLGRSIYGNPYAGLVPRLMGVIPMRTVFWGTRGIAERATKDMNASSQLAIVTLSSSFAQTLLDTPIETAKMRQITGTSAPLFRGFHVTLSRNIIFAGALNTAIYLDDGYLGAALGGLAGSVLSQPLDHIKTHAQNSSSPKISYRNIIKNQYSQGNLRVFMSGMAPRASMSFINMGIGYYVYNHVLQRINRN